MSLLKTYEIFFGFQRFLILGFVDMKLKILFTHKNAMPIEMFAKCKVSITLAFFNNYNVPLF